MSDEQATPAFLCPTGVTKVVVVCMNVANDGLAACYWEGKGRIIGVAKSRNVQLIEGCFHKAHTTPHLVDKHSPRMELANPLLSTFYVFSLLVMSCLVGNIRQRGFKFLSVKSLS